MSIVSDSDELPVAIVPPASASSPASGSSATSAPQAKAAPSAMEVLAADAATPRIPSTTPASGRADSTGSTTSTGTGAATGETADKGNGKGADDGASGAAAASAKGTKGAAKPAKRAVKKRAVPAGKKGKPKGAQKGKPQSGQGSGAAPAVAAAGASTGARSEGGTTRSAGAARPGGGPRRPPLPAWVVRLFAPPNIDGPRARFGIVWMLFAVPAVYFGAPWVAALWGLHAGIAALQTGQVWRREGYRASRLVAAPAAVALPVLALFSYTAPGVVVLALPFVAMIAALVIPRRRRKLSAAAVAGATLRCAVPAGVAAMGMVFVARLGPQTGLVFLGLLSAYDLGFFVFGAETRSGVPGIVMGALTSLACTGALVAASVFLFRIPPFDGSTEEWVFGALVAVFAPLGQLIASLALPTARSWVPALRRLDSYILAAPVWAWVLWTIV